MQCSLFLLLIKSPPWFIEQAIEDALAIIADLTQQSSERDKGRLLEVNTVRMALPPFPP